jgi:hypothetical protein
MIRGLSRGVDWPDVNTKPFSALVRNSISIVWVYSLKQWPLDLAVEVKLGGPAFVNAMRPTTDTPGIV